MRIDISFKLIAILVAIAFVAVQESTTEKKLIDIGFVIDLYTHSTRLNKWNASSRARQDRALLAKEIITALAESKKIDVKVAHIRYSKKIETKEMMGGGSHAMVGLLSTDLSKASGFDPEQGLRSVDDVKVARNSLMAAAGNRPEAPDLFVWITTTGTSDLAQVNPYDFFTKTSIEVMVSLYDNDPEKNYAKMFYKTENGGSGRILDNTLTELDENKLKKIGVDVRSKIENLAESCTSTVSYSICYFSDANRTRCVKDKIYTPNGKYCRNGSIEEPCDQRLSKNNCILQCTNFIAKNREEKRVTDGPCFVETEKRNAECDEDGTQLRRPEKAVNDKLYKNCDFTEFIEECQGPCDSGNPEVTHPIKPNKTDKPKKAALEWWMIVLIAVGGVTMVAILIGIIACRVSMMRRGQRPPRFVGKGKGAASPSRATPSQRPTYRDISSRMPPTRPTPSQRPTYRDMSSRKPATRPTSSRMTSRPPTSRR